MLGDKLDKLCHDIASSMVCNVPELRKQNQKFILPLFIKKSPRSKAELVGSGILLRIKDKKFLLTCSHIDCQKNQYNGLFYYVSGNNPKLEIKKTLKYDDSNSGICPGRSSDKIDISIYEIENFCVKEYSFLQLKDTASDHSPKKHRLYGFLGYPISKNKKIKNNVVKIRGYGLVSTPATDDDYSKYRYDPKKNFLLQFDSKKGIIHGTDEPLRSPGNEVAFSPKGMSGGGVFWYSDGVTLENGNKLVAIAIAIHDDILASTKIDVAIKLLRQNYQGLIL